MWIVSPESIDDKIDRYFCKGAMVKEILHVFFACLGIVSERQSH